MRGGFLCGLAVAGVLLAPVRPAIAQSGEAASDISGQVLVLDQDRLFGESRFGKAVMARYQTSVEALQEENRRIEADLEAEERDLTERRAKLPALEFQGLAAEFDNKAEAIRKAQTAKSNDIKLRLDAERRQFVETVRPVLQELLQQSGASIIIDGRAVFFAVPGLDVTDQAIARMDEVLGDGPSPMQGDATPPDAAVDEPAAAP